MCHLWVWNYCESWQSRLESLTQFLLRLVVENESNILVSPQMSTLPQDPDLELKNDDLKYVLRLYISRAAIPKSSPDSRTGTDHSG
jgi:hypothetical protein